jgi:hypothetical protein
MGISYVGVDLGSSNFHQAALNHRGAQTLNREFTTSEANLIKAFADLHGEIHVHLEAGELAPWASEIIRPLVLGWFARIRKPMPGSPGTGTSVTGLTLTNWPACRE